MTFKAVIFDLDGTLLNTLEDICDSVNRVLKNRGFKEHKLEEYQYFVGEGAGVLIERVLPKSQKSPKIIQDCLNDFKVDYSKNWDNKTSAFLGINELLTELTKRNIVVSILSNKPQFYTELCVKKFFKDHKFKIIYGQRETVPRKPDPTSAIEISKIININPENILYVGDTPIDMQTANSAGMYAVGVSWGFRPVEELIRNKAKVIIQTPDELLKLL